MHRRLSLFLSSAGLVLLVSCATPGNANSNQVMPNTAPNKTEAPFNASSTPDKRPESCPITQPPEALFVPPAPYPAQPPARYAGQFWYGSPELWTMLMMNGTWSELPHGARGYSQKVFWWQQGYSMDAEPSPQLTVTGRRLDAPAEAIEGSGATNAEADFGQAMLIGIDLPTAGCWEITGHYRGRDLSFVVWVTP